MAMAVRMTVNDMMDRYCPGLNELYDGEKRTVLPEHLL